MKLKILFSTLICLITIIVSCKHKANEFTPEPIKSTTLTTGSPSTTNTNIIDSVCFSEQILPILASNCAMSGCHNDTAKSAGICLISYATLKATLSGTLLLQSIQDTGPLGMPLGGPQLNQTQINLIKTWVNQGMKEGIDCLGPCDTTNITFSGTIFPIFQNNCIGCHSTSLPILSGYTDIKAQVDNGKILCTINHSSGCSPMPKNTAQLSACKIKQITKWINASAPNN